MQSCRMQQENEVPTRNMVEKFSVFAWLYKIKCTCFQNILSFTGNTIPEKLNLPNKQLRHLKHYFVDISVLQVLYSLTPKQVLKTCAF